VESMDGTPLPPEEIPVMRALAGEKVRTILHFQPPRRPARWLSVSAAPIRRAGASSASAVAILTDITEVRDLQQEQELFMQMISHDLRTPITVIQGHAELLIEHLSERDEMTDLHLEAITAATWQLAGMMEDLSWMIQQERGQLPLDLERLDVEEFTVKLVDRMTMSGIGRALEKSFPPNLPPLFADRVSVERILTNLLTNAFKYSPADSPVKVAAQAVGDEMRISVQDRGKGIAPEDQPLLFQRFFRAGNSGGKKGIGLGLYITRRLVEAHGGRVWVESEPGKGSIFTISLPLRADEDQWPGSASP
jgi:two-component system, NtrC family, sensor histidine kinase KinB